MWFSRLGALEDKFEATLPNKARERFLERDRRYAEQLATNTTLLPLIQNMTDRGVESGRRMFAVNCRFLGKQESERMWHDFGQEGKGIAVQSTVERLLTSFQILGGFTKLSAIDRVQYVDFESHDLSEADALKIDAKAFLKIKNSAHEQEVRILTPNFLHSGCLNSLGFEDGTDRRATLLELLEERIINFKDFFAAKPQLF